MGRRALYLGVALVGMLIALIATGIYFQQATRERNNAQKAATAEAKQRQAAQTAVAAEAIARQEAETEKTKLR